MNIHRHPHGHMSGGCCCVWRYRTTVRLFLLLACFGREHHAKLFRIMYHFCTRFLGRPKCPDTYRKQEHLLLPAAVVLLKSCLPTISARNIQPKSAPFLLRFCAMMNSFLGPEKSEYTPARCTLNQNTCSFERQCPSLRFSPVHGVIHVWQVKRNVGDLRGKRKSRFCPCGAVALLLS